MPVTLESLKKSIGKKNSNSMVFAWIADLERLSNNLDASLNRVDGGLTLYPDDSTAMVVRAKILLERKEFEKCIEQCKNLIKKDPCCMAAYKLLGDAYDNQGDVAKRNANYRTFHDMDPLNEFWRDEYDVIPDDSVDLSDEFTMPAGGDDSLAMSLVDVKPDDVEPIESPTSDTFDFTLDDDVPEEKNADLNLEDDDIDDSSLFTKSVEDNHVGDSEDDPFATLAAMLPNNESADDSAVETLLTSLDDVMAGINAEESTKENLSGDESISGSDVTSALEDMFGLEDDLEVAETPSDNAGSLTQEIPSSIEDSAQSEQIQPAVSKPADEPMSVDSAFASIFGDDELPEETSSSLPKQAMNDDLGGGLFEKSAESDIFDEDTKPVEEKNIADEPMSVDSAFASIFGDDELLEDKAEPAKSEPAPSGIAEPASEPLSVDGAFDSLFGKDELPLEEGPSKVDDGLKLDDELKLDDGLKFGDDLKLDDELPEDKAEPAKSEPAPSGIAEPASEPLSVDGAFDSLFGKDELPLEEGPSKVDDGLQLDDELKLDDGLKLADELNLDDGLKFGDDLKLNDDLMLDDEPSLALNDELNIEGNEPLVTEDVVEKVKSVDVPTDPVITSPMDFVLDDLPEVKEQSSDFAKEMGGAFASMFGSDDDLSDVGLEKIEKFETPLSANPEELQSDLDKNFDSLFGKDDAEEPAVENPVPLSAPDLNSLESEVSSAFKDLFNMEENDEPMPSNSGVDFLMSGDSDDEISAALIKNPEAPLEKNLNDIDESLNTRTLAEIYYDQGLYGKALDIYTDLLQKEPENEEILKRFEEVEQMYRNKFGGKA